MRNTCLFLIFYFFLATTSYGQSTDASVTGTIRSADEGPLPGATVTLRNESTGFQTGTVTNLNGKFDVKQLPLGGPYTVTASFVGYSEVQKTGF